MQKVIDFTGFAQQTGLSVRDVERIHSIVFQFEVEECFIFGSRAKGTFRKGSDVDLALSGNLTEKEAKKIHYQLNEETTMPYFFDIVIVDENLDEALKEHIARVGLPLPK
jgi:predicted nucleotidyltransferase